MSDWEDKLENRRVLTYEETRDAWTQILLLRAGVSGDERPLLDEIAKALTEFAPDLAEALADRFFQKAKTTTFTPNANLLGLLQYEEEDWWK